MHGSAAYKTRQNSRWQGFAMTSIPLKTRIKRPAYHAFRSFDTGQTVPHASFRQEVLGLRRINLELVSQRAYVDPKIVRVLDVLGPPDFLQELTVCPQAARMA